MSSSISLLPTVEFLEAIARYQWRTDAEYILLRLKLLLCTKKKTMLTSTDYISSVSLIPTVDFLEEVTRQQWSTDSEYFIGFSHTRLEFYSSPASEIICLNLESELLGSEYSSVKIRNPFAYTRPELSPVFAVHQKERHLLPSQKPESIFLYRLSEDKKEIILASNFRENAIEAPPLDCFSRECLSWFNSNTDYFVGFGTYPESIGTIAEGDSIAVLTKSEDLLLSAINFSTASISYTNIQVVNTTSILQPYVKIQFCTGVEYINTATAPDPNFLFLYTVNNSGDSLVSFVHDFQETITGDAIYGAVTADISWNQEDIIIF